MFEMSAIGFDGVWLIEGNGRCASASQDIALLFDSGGVTVNESGGTAHTASNSLLAPVDRATMIAAVQAIYDDALGTGKSLIHEGTGGCINVVVSNGTSPTGLKYGNAGERQEPAIVYEGEFRNNPVFTTEAELALAMAETVAHEIGHKLGLGGHNCDSPPNLMTAGEKVDPNTRKLGGRLFDASAKIRLANNETLITAEPKPDSDPNDLAILNGSFCVPPPLIPDDGYLTATGNLTSGESFVEFGYLNSLGEFVYQGDSNNPVVPLGSHFDGGFDLAVRSGSTIYSFSNGGGCFSLSVPNPNNPAVSLRADVSFPAAGATLVLDVQNAANTTGGLLLPPEGGCGTASFCTSKTALVCGAPAIASSGTPSATSTGGFTVSAGPARSCKSGILLYSDQATAAGIPFQGGTLCLNPMGLRRAGSTNSMGTPGPSNCDGEFSLDMNAFAQSAWVVPACDGSPSGIPPNNPAGFLTNAGTTISVQYWGRDSQGTGSFVSGGLQYVIGP